MIVNSRFYRVYLKFIKSIESLLKKNLLKSQLTKDNHKLIKNLATCFGLGEMSFMPGTFGTLGGIPIFLFLTYIKRFFINVMVYNSFYLVFLVTFFAIAVYVSDICEKEIFKRENNIWHIR